MPHGGCTGSSTRPEVRRSERRCRRSRGPSARSCSLPATAACRSRSGHRSRSPGTPAASRRTTPGQARRRPPAAGGVTRTRPGAGATSRMETHPGVSPRLASMSTARRAFAMSSASSGVSWWRVSTSVSASPGVGGEGSGRVPPEAVVTAQRVAVADDEVPSVIGPALIGPALIGAARRAPCRRGRAAGRAAASARWRGWSTTGRGRSSGWRPRRG